MSTTKRFVIGQMSSLRRQSIHISTSNVRQSLSVSRLRRQFCLCNTYYLQNEVMGTYCSTKRHHLSDNNHHRVKSSYMETIKKNWQTSRNRNFSSSSSVVAGNKSGTSSTTTETTSSSYEQAIAKLPDGAQIHLDFFGEPTTFFGVTTTSSSSTTTSKESVSNAMAALDGFIIGVVSKGKAFSGGGQEEGLAIQAAHSAAIGWSELLRYATIWNDTTNTIDTNDNNRGKTANLIKSAPMLAYTAVAPMLAQTGVGYVRYVDHLLQQVESGVEGISSIQMLNLAKTAASMKDHPHLNPREKSHLQALDCMLRHDYKRAMMILLKLLQTCPGDALALSIVMDLTHTVGDKDSALRAAGSVAAYWNERQGSFLRPGIPGHNATSALIALGLAVGGRIEEAETLATFAMDKGLNKVSRGVATWALAHIFDSQGRTAEGISACANSDGIRNFDECGLLFFDTILSGYGVRFALDREERGRGKSAGLRLYDSNYERILDYSGFAKGQAWQSPTLAAPMGWKKSNFDATDTPRSFINRLFGNSESNSNDERRSNQTVKGYDNGDDEDDNNSNNTADDGDIIVQEGRGAASSLSEWKKKENWNPSVEDVLTWLPPTPQLLSDATLLLLRLTLNGTIASSNYRWDNIRNAWSVMLELQSKYGGSDYNTFEFYPLVSVTASLMALPDHTGAISATSSIGQESASARLAKGLHKMGELLNLGDITRYHDDDDDDDDDDDQNAIVKADSHLSHIIIREIVAEKDPDFWLPVAEESKKKDWMSVLKLLSSAIDGVYHDDIYDDDYATGTGMKHAELSTPFESWEFDVRPALEHAVVYAACKCGDNDSLGLARSICSRGVTLRPNSPEEWWRYSIVLGLLGDEVASEHALEASVQFGGGQGARGGE